MKNMTWIKGKKIKYEPSEKRINGDIELELMEVETNFSFTFTEIQAFEEVNDTELILYFKNGQIERVKLTEEMAKNLK